MYHFDLTGSGQDMVMADPSMNAKLLFPIVNFKE